MLTPTFIYEHLPVSQVNNSLRDRNVTRNFYFLWTNMESEVIMNVLPYTVRVNVCNVNQFFTLKIMEKEDI